MSAKVYRIKLSENERCELEVIRDRGTLKAKTFKEALALLSCDEGDFGPALADEAICRLVGISPSSLLRLRQRCCETGPSARWLPSFATNPPGKSKSPAKSRLGLPNSPAPSPPEGAARWTLRLLANHLVESEVIESISHTTVGLV